MSHPLAADPTHGDVAHGDVTHGDVASDDVAAPARPTGLTTPDLRYERPVVSVVRLLARKPVLLLPLALVFLLSTLGTAAVEVVRAWTGPALLRDGTFVYAEVPSTAAVVTVVALGLLGTAAAGVALGVVVLRTGALLLGVRSGAVASLREALRRWPLTLGGSLVLVVATCVTAVAAVVLMVLAGPVVGGFVAVALSVLVVQVTVKAARPLVAALLHGTRARDARRGLADGRRYGEVREHGRRAEHVVVGAVVGVVAAAGCVRWVVTGGPGAPGRDVVVEGLSGAAGSVLLTFTTMVLTWFHLRSVHLVELRGNPPQVWGGVVRVMAGPAVAPPADAADGPRPAPGRRVAAAVVVVAVWASLPGILAAPVALDLTPAPSPRTTELGRYVHDPVLAGMPDGGVAVFSRYDGDDTLTRCTPAGECVVEVTRDLAPVAAVPDPDGAGLAVLDLFWGETAGERGYVLVTCSPEGCADPAGRVTRTTVTTPEGVDTQPDDVAVRDGVLAAVHPAGGYADPSRALLLCRISACDDPTTLPLGPASDTEPAVAVASGGVAWVARSTGSQLRLSRAEVGSEAVTDVQVVELGRAHDAATDGPPRRADQSFAVLDLALLDDDSPVVLHRRSPGGRVEVLTCSDARCSSTTSVTVPGGAPVDAALAVDGSGLPLVATVADAGVVLHACRDRACTAVRSGLMATRWPVYGFLGDAVPFFALDGKDRPVALLEKDWGEAVVVQCPEPRCGL